MRKDLERAFGGFGVNVAHFSSSRSLSVQDRYIHHDEGLN